MAVRFLLFILVFLSIILLLYFLGVVISHLIYTIKLNKFLNKLEKENKDDSI